MFKKHQLIPVKDTVRWLLLSRKSYIKISHHFTPKQSNWKRQFILKVSDSKNKDSFFKYINI